MRTPSKSWITRVAVATLAAFFAVTVAPAVGVADVVLDHVRTGTATDMSIPLFKSRVVTVDEPASRVAVGSPDIADVVVISPTQVYILAKDIGSTNLLFWARDGRLIGSVNLEVVHDLEGLKQKLHQFLPDEPIEVYSAQRSIVLRGRASSLEAMNAAVRIAEGYLAQVQPEKTSQQFEQESGSRREDKTVGKVINLIEIGGSQQVMLEVKVAEVARTELKRLNAQYGAVYTGGSGTLGGVNGGGVLNGDGSFVPNPLQVAGQGFFGTFVNDSFRFNMALDAAKENGLARILAEPTLTTLTGQEAEFLSGGEFPIPVPQGISGAVTIEFKKYGVGLKFLPVVLSDGRINLKVNVSVSEIDDTNSVVLQSAGVSLKTVVPALKQRSASATVELGDGQSMGLAGLLDDSMRSSVSKFPGLGSIPVLGALFRSNQYQKGQTELVILVTPHLAKPVAPGSVKLPGEGLIEPSDTDFYIWGRNEGGQKPAGGQQTN